MLDVDRLWIGTSKPLDSSGLENYKAQRGIVMKTKSMGVLRQ